MGDFIFKPLVGLTLDGDWKGNQCGVSFTPIFESDVEIPIEPTNYSCRDIFLGDTGLHLMAGAELGNGTIGAVPLVGYYQLGSSYEASQITDSDLQDYRFVSSVERGIEGRLQVSIRPNDKFLIAPYGGVRYGWTSFGTGTPRFGFGNQPDKGSALMQYPPFDFSQDTQHPSVSLSPVAGLGLGIGPLYLAGNVTFPGALTPGEGATKAGAQFIQQRSIGDEEFYKQTGVARTANSPFFGLQVGILWGPSSSSSSSSSQELGEQLGTEGLPEN